VAAASYRGCAGVLRKVLTFRQAILFLTRAMRILFSFPIARPRSLAALSFSSSVADILGRRTPVPTGSVLGGHHGLAARRMVAKALGNCGGIRTAAGSIFQMPALRFTCSSTGPPQIGPPVFRWLISRIAGQEGYIRF
jgi:hypothetical protein